MAMTFCAGLRLEDLYVEIDTVMQYSYCLQAPSCNMPCIALDDIIPSGPAYMIINIGAGYDCYIDSKLIALHILISITKPLKYNPRVNLGFSVSP